MNILDDLMKTSIRRYFVDRFFFNNSKYFSHEQKVVDIGGHSGPKRGVFDIDKFDCEVTYVNIDKSKNPHILADASSIPIADSSYDVAVFGEVLEHVPDPRLALKEAFRLLKPGGVVLATVPFIFPIHSDPYDYGRYTPEYWSYTSKELGYKEVIIEKQGNFFAVAALMLQHLFLSQNKSWRPLQKPLLKILMKFNDRTTSPLLTSWTTGFGLIFKK